MAANETLKQITAQVAAQNKINPTAINKAIKTLEAAKQITKTRLEQKG
jgi:hypothetical protein